MAFDEVNLLEKREIKLGERWILSEGFDVEPDFRDDSRINHAIEDIKQLVNSGAKVSILSHQRRFSKNPLHLDFVANYMTEKLIRKVKYFPNNNTSQAVDFANQMQPGDITLFGNTRFNEGEEKNNPELARQFAKLGDFAAIGGWCKAHRKNASNVGILEFIPGYMTRNQLREMQILKPWTGKSDEYSIAVLGGVKKEKITEGLAVFAETYDIIIPGGIVLNNIYLVQGKRIGKSIVDDEGKVCDEDVKKVLDSENRWKVCIPEEVVIAQKIGEHYKNPKTIAISNGVPDDFMIVDFIMPESARAALATLSNTGGRLVIAGTPGIYKKGFREATNYLLDFSGINGIEAIALGGDTASELQNKFKGTKSIGGGASLVYAVRGTTAVYEALKENKRRFG